MRPRQPARRGGKTHLVCTAHEPVRKARSIDHPSSSVALKSRAVAVQTVTFGVRGPTYGCGDRHPCSAFRQQVWAPHQHDLEAYMSNDIETAAQTRERRT